MAADHPGDPREWIDPDEYARRLGVSRHTVNVYAKRGLIVQKVLSRRTRLLAWPPLGAELQQQADHRASQQRRKGGKGATMRRSRPDDLGGTDQE